VIIWYIFEGQEEITAKSAAKVHIFCGQFDFLVSTFSRGHQATSLSQRFIFFLCKMPLFVCHDFLIFGGFLNTGKMSDFTHF